MNMNPYLSPLTKIKSRWIKDLNLRPQTIKLLLENTGETLGDIGVGKDVLNKTPNTQSIIPKIDKWDYIRLRNSCMTKDTEISVNRQPSEWENIFVSHASDKGLITRIYKEQKKLFGKKMMNPIKRWEKELKRTLAKDDIQIARRHMKKCSTSLIVREM